MLSPKSIKELLKAVLIHAESLNIEAGVAAVIITDVHTAETITEWLPLHGKIERPPNPSILGDIGTNYFSTTFIKLGEMMLSGNDSGPTSKTPRQGELGYAGGITWREGKFVYRLAFSGGTEEQDTECVKYAKKVTKL